MKKISLVLISAFIAISLNLKAQSVVDKIFDKYNGSAGFTSVTMNKGMFEIISRMDASDDGKEFRNAISKIESIRILAMDSINSGPINLFDIVMKALPTKDYKELMTVKEEDTDVKFLIREKGDIITELLIVAGGSQDDNALIVIKGEIDLATIGSIAKNMDIKGLNQLEKLKDKK